VLFVASMTLTIIHAGAVGAVLCAPRRWLTEDRHVTKFVEACLSIDNSCTLGSFMLVIIAMIVAFLAKSESKRSAAVAWLAAALVANIVLSCLMPVFGFS